MHKFTPCGLGRHSYGVRTQRYALAQFAAGGARATSIEYSSILEYLPRPLRDSALARGCRPLPHTAVRRRTKSMAGGPGALREPQRGGKRSGLGPLSDCPLPPLGRTASRAWRTGSQRPRGGAATASNRSRARRGLRDASSTRGRRLAPPPAMPPPGRPARLRFAKRSLSTHLSSASAASMAAASLVGCCLTKGSICSATSCLSSIGSCLSLHSPPADASV